MSVAATSATLRLAGTLLRARATAANTNRVTGYNRGGVALNAAICPTASVSRSRWNSSFAPRVGKAVEPEKDDALAGGAREEQQQAEEAVGEKDAQKASPEPTQSTARQTKSVVKLDEVASPTYEKAKGHHLDPREAGAQSETNGQDGPSSAPETNSSISELASAETPDDASLDPRTRQVREDAKQSGPLEAVLQMQSPAKVARQHPHMSPPRYVHNFDSYSLVRQLNNGGYTPNQAIESMKGIRALLAQNLDKAQESLVSKSDVENETYLFRAACSELGQEIKNNRRLQDEQLRQQRTHLQHEVDILTQSLNQEILSLNDNVRGMFNDRKMAVREEQKGADSAVQQINYKISTSLVSDSKSEIESVRWILIRRSALGIFFMAMLTLLTVRYGTYLVNERQREATRKKEEEDRVRRDGGKRDNSSAADAAVILAAN